MAGIAELMEHDLVERGVPKNKSFGSRTMRTTREKKRKR